MTGRQNDRLKGPFAMTLRQPSGRPEPIGHETFCAAGSGIRNRVLLIKNSNNSNFPQIVILQNWSKSKRIN